MAAQTTNETEMQELKIKFDGNTHLIDANTFINSLLHFTNIVQEINSELSNEKKIEIKIKATPEGSFIVDLIFSSHPIITGLTTLFLSKETTTYIESLVNVIKGIYETHKFLNGKKPVAMEQVDSSTKITNESGQVTYIDNRTINIYKDNTIVRQGLASQFLTLDDDANVTGFELLNKEDKPEVQIERKQFTALSSAENFTTPKEQDITKSGILNIVTLSFEHKDKWRFVYEGNRIAAKMSDDFFESIDKGEKFAKGDQLEAELEIRQEFDDTAQAYINKSYRIKKIIRHIPRAEQGKLL